MCYIPSPPPPPEGKNDRPVLGWKKMIMCQWKTREIKRKEKKRGEKKLEKNFSSIFMSYSLRM